MTELQTNRYDQLLRRVGDLKGPGSKVNDVLQELFPTLDVENVPGELLLLMGTRIGWGGTAKTPTAGKIAGIQLFNPANSGHMISISHVDISANGANVWQWGTTVSALGVDTGLARPRDVRLGTGAAGVAQLRTSGDAVGIAVNTLRTTTNTPYRLTDINSFCVLPEGTGITFTGTTDVIISLSFFYRERIAEPSEVNF